MRIAQTLGRTLTAKRAKGVIHNYMNTLNGYHYTFSLPKEDIFFGKYLIRIVAVVWFVLFAFECLWGVGFPTLKVIWPVGSIFIALPVFVAAGLLFYWSLHKLAYQVEFDFQNKIVTFFTFRRKRTITHNISDLEIIRLNWHTQFIFKNGETIKYKADHEFFVFLKQFDIQREWGYFGKFFLKKEYRADLE
jgi:hypothetical protein